MSPSWTQAALPLVRGLFGVGRSPPERPHGPFKADLPGEQGFQVQSKGRTGGVGAPTCSIRTVVWVRDAGQASRRGGPGALGACWGSALPPRRSLTEVRISGCHPGGNWGLELSTSGRCRRSFKPRSPPCCRGSDQCGSWRPPSDGQR